MMMSKKKNSNPKIKTEGRKKIDSKTYDKFDIQNSPLIKKLFISNSLKIKFLLTSNK